MDACIHACPQVLKRIEAGAGRDLAGGQRFGPRPLDMDIIFYGSDSMQLGETLTVPHARWACVQVGMFIFFFAACEQIRCEN